MQQNPNTDKTVGVRVGHGVSFSAVRARSRSEQDNRDRHKSKKAKDILQPKFRVDQEIVLVKRACRNDRDYLKVRVLDISSPGRFGNEFVYYAIVLKVTDSEDAARIGRLIHFYGTHWYGSGFEPAGAVDDGTIRWKAVLDE